MVNPSDGAGDRLVDCVGLACSAAGRCGGGRSARSERWPRSTALCVAQDCAIFFLGATSSIGSLAVSAALCCCGFRSLPKRANAHAPTERNFALRLTGPIDQKALRNLLIWQNQVLPSYLRPDDNGQVDVALVLSAGSDNETRLFDLISIVPMLERIRNFVVFWDEETAADAASILMSDKELACWRAAGGASRSRKNVAQHYQHKSNSMGLEAVSGCSSMDVNMPMISSS